MSLAEFAIITMWVTCVLCGMAAVAAAPLGWLWESRARHRCTS